MARTRARVRRGDRDDRRVLPVSDYGQWKVERVALGWKWQSAAEAEESRGSVRLRADRPSVGAGLTSWKGGGDERSRQWCLRASARLWWMGRTKQKGKGREAEGSFGIFEKGIQIRNSNTNLNSTNKK
jgi:hypothetical protein